MKWEAAFDAAALESAALRDRNTELEHQVTDLNTQLVTANAGQQPNTPSNTLPPATAQPPPVQGGTAAQPRPGLQLDTAGNEVHTLQSGDNLWALATRFLGSGARYPEIIAANANNMTAAEIRDLPVGRQIIIPR
jgi:nucleoid-associated protein YgaU